MNFLFLALSALLLLLRGGESATIFDYPTHADEMIWNRTNDQQAGWQPNCGANETTDGCTFDVNYWATHHGIPYVAVKHHLWVNWPTDPVSVTYEYVFSLSGLIDTLGFKPFCFDFGRYSVRHPSFGGNVTPPFVVKETLISEKTTFNGGMTHVNLLNSVREGDLATPCALLSAEYIAALLNRCNRACAPPGFNETITEIARLVYSPECFQNPLLPGPPNGPWEEHLQFLKDYNTGRVTYSHNGTCAPIVEPGYCYTGPGLKPDNVTCTIDIPPCDLNFECPTGCTHSSGYWAGHRLTAASVGVTEPAPIGWDDICEDSFLVASKPNGSTAGLEFSPFLLTGLTWGGILDTASLEDACIVASKQIVATQLNTNCNTPACIPPQIHGALVEAIAIVEVYCRGESSRCDGLGLCLDTNLTSVRRDLLRHAKFLENYNTGRHGPGPCGCGDMTSEYTAADEGKDQTIALQHAQSIATVTLVLVILTMFCMAVGLGAIAIR